MQRAEKSVAMYESGKLDTRVAKQMAKVDFSLGIAIHYHQYASFLVAKIRNHDIPITVIERKDE